MQDKLMTAVRKAVQSSISASVEDVETIKTEVFVEKLLDEWIYVRDYRSFETARRYSGALFFLFLKNTAVTNLVHSELAELVDLHATTRADGAVRFMDVYSYAARLTAILEEAWRNSPLTDVQKADPESIVEAVSNELYSILDNDFRELIYDTICVRNFFTSCAIYVPRSIEIDLIEVVASSGYIHSAGPLTWIRNSDEATLHELSSSFSRFVEKYPDQALPFYFTPYAKEFFDGAEALLSVASTRNGLDGVRLKLGRHHLNGITLSDALKALEIAHDGKIVIPTGSDENYLKERANCNAYPFCTLWLIVDHDSLPSEGAANSVRSRKSYVISYVQVARNHSQLVTLKERKPAWFAPNTLPHTLSKAMLNIAQSHLNLADGETAAVLDPFCGTGTTLIDAATTFENCVLVGMDRNPISSRLTNDNLQFLAWGERELQTFDDELSSFGTIFSQMWDANEISLKRLGEQFDAESVNAPEDWHIVREVCAYTLDLIYQELSGTLFDVGKALQSILDEQFSDQLLSQLNHSSFELRSRLMFYIVWRALANNQFRLRLNYSAAKFAVTNEISDTQREIRSLRDLARSSEWVREKRYSKYNLKLGSYSPEFSFDHSVFANVKWHNPSDQLQPLIERVRKSRGRNIVVKRVSDSVRELAKTKNVFDVIIMDPPYGINVSEGGGNRFLLDLFPNAVAALRSGGIILTTLPEFNKNGGGTSYFQSYEFASTQIGEAARQIGRIPSEIVPREHIVNMYGKNRWYWASPNALERSIVAFKID